MISITGLDAIDKVLKALPETVQNSVLASAHYMAAKPLVAAEKSLAPVGATRNLVDSIGAYKTGRKKQTSLGEVIVGPGRKRGKKGYHAHFPEFGTKPRRTKSGANRGIMPKKPYAKPAFERTKGQIESTIANEIGKSMVRTMKKYL